MEIMILLVLVFIAWAINLFRYPIRVLAGKLKRLFRVWTGKQIPNIFEHHYLDGRLFYMYRFKMVPCIKFVNEMDISQAFRFMEDNCRELTLDIFQSSYLNREQNKQEFSKTVFVLRNKLVVELAGEYARIYHPNNRYGEADEIVKAFTAYKTPEKEKEFEINIITMSRDGLELKRLDIKPTVLDIDLYYNDDFKEVDELIRKRLGQQNDKGIVLGVGTIKNMQHAKDYLAAGADFLVSPGFVPDVAVHCVANDIFYGPGCMTPTEIIAAENAGIGSAARCGGN